MKDIINFEIIYLRLKFSLWRNKRKANRMHKLSGKRYHVILHGTTSYTVVDNSFIKTYNKIAKKLKQKTIRFVDLLEMSYYSTPVQGVTRNNIIKKKSNSFLIDWSKFKI